VVRKGGVERERVYVSLLCRPYRKIVKKASKKTKDCGERGYWCRMAAAKLIVVVRIVKKI